MLKRMLTVAVTLLVLVPAAVAANGASPRPSHPQPSAHDQQAPGQRTSSLEQRLADVRQRIEKAAADFNKRCASQHTDVERCTVAAKKLVAVLKKLDARLDAVIAKIHERCDGASDGTGRNACKHADQLIKKLGDLQAQIQRVEAKLEAWLEQGATDSSATDSGSLESIDELQAELAKLAAAGQRL